VKYLGEGESQRVAKEPIELPYRDFMKEKPIADEIFEIYMGMYAYDKTELNSIIESVDESVEDFRKEVISFDAAYSGERVFAYLFLPKNGVPPYQGVIYFPGSNAISRRSSKTNESLFFRNYDFIIRSGRALIFPIYKGTYERGDKLESSMPEGTKLYRDHVINWAQDLSRTIDYIETRDDIDTDKLAYYGLSWGGRMGGLMPVVENRFKICVLNVAGLRFQKSMPEVDPINFISRFKIPVLMLNGRLDHFFPYETSQIPLYTLIGTPSEHKRHIVYETGHFVPKTQVIKEVLAWLDEYLGPVK